MPYTQPKRIRGVTKNNLYMLYDLGVQGIVNHSRIPLRLAAIIGFVSSVVSLGAALVYFVMKMLFWYDLPIGVAPVIIGLFCVASVQLFFLGVLGEYVGSIYTQVRNRPLVIEQERINLIARQTTAEGATGGPTGPGSGRWRGRGASRPSASRRCVAARPAVLLAARDRVARGRADVAGADRRSSRSPPRSRSATLFLRPCRWRILLNAEGHVSVPAAFWATAAGLFGNNFLPARAGELVRTYMISRAVRPGDSRTCWQRRCRSGSPTPSSSR